MDLFKLCNIDFEIFVPLEFGLNWYNVLCVPNLPFVGFFEVLLELVKLVPQLFPLILDIIQLSGDVLLTTETILLYDCFSLIDTQIDIYWLLITHHAPSRGALFCCRLRALA